MSKSELYRDLVDQLRELLTDEHDVIANSANTASLVFHALADVNWVGFYFLKEGELVLGPFQGKPACRRIALGRGVCGTAADRRETIVVSDVHAFAGHIACDTASRAEIVIPMLHDRRLLGVFDLDSPTLGRFDDSDQAGLEAVVDVLVRACDWT